MNWKTVRSHGLDLFAVSRNERNAEVNGRFFLASRCRPGRPILVTELDRDILAHGSAKDIGTFGPFHVSMRNIGRVISGIVGKSE